ncbi:MAG: hypothetical protein KAT25_07875 [Sulfuriflexus sp.]|nr:hypothetical protein [Sulfuriflexus sp.]
MKYIKNEEIRDADGAEDAQQATGLLEARLQEMHQKITELPAGFDPKQKGELLIQTSAILVDLERGEEAFAEAREAFDIFKEAEEWEALAQTCNNMFLADQPESLPALGQGIWVAVTFPEVDPELTVALLQHVVNETPPDSDGGALAAAVAHYIADMRTEGKKHEDLTFFTNSLLGTVARRHSEVESQEQFELWFERMELNDPDQFLGRMRNVIDVLVQDDWWIDRDAIWATLPVN